MRRDPNRLAAPPNNREGSWLTGPRWYAFGPEGEGAVVYMRPWARGVVRRGKDRAASCEARWGEVMVASWPSVELRPTRTGWERREQPGCWVTGDGVGARAVDVVKG